MQNIRRMIYRTCRVQLGTSANRHTDTCSGPGKVVVIPVWRKPWKGAEGLKKKKEA